MSGNFANHWEAHLEPDWLLIWKTDRKKIIVTLTDTGSHAELLKKKLTLIAKLRKKMRLDILGQTI